jgi:hypothetical protein
MIEDQGAVSDDRGEACVHYWLIDEKNLGVCKKCGVEKRFSSAWEWGGNQRTGVGRYSKGQKTSPATATGVMPKGPGAAP